VPKLNQSPSKIAYAVNEQFVSQDTPLQDGDVLALIPPVSGG
jgi:molybdopterin converting factor small subunit